MLGEADMGELLISELIFSGDNKRIHTQVEAPDIWIDVVCSEKEGQRGKRRVKKRSRRRRNGEGIRLHGMK